MRSTKTDLAKNISANARLDHLDILARYFLTSNKLFEELRLEFVHFDPPRVEVRIPFNGQFELSAGEGLSFGILTTALDSIFGLIILANLKELVPVATIDLNVEFTSTPRRGQSVVCHAEYGALLDQVAHVRGHVVGEETGQIFAFGSATFMVGTRGPEIGSVA